MARLGQFLATSFLLAALNASSAIYRFDFVALKGQAGLSSIKQEVSINDVGRIAFIGLDSSNSAGVWVGDGNGSDPVIRVLPLALQPATSLFRRLLMEMWLLREKMCRVSRCPMIRRWPEASTVADSGSTYLSLTTPSVNNVGEVAFVALVGEQGSPQLVLKHLGS